MTALATNESTGDTSAFSNAVPAQAVSIAFSSATYSVASTAGTALITVVRSGNSSAAVSVEYATSNGTAIAGQGYVATTGTLVFPPNATTETFSVTILPNTNSSVSSATVNLTLFGPGGGATLGSIASAVLTITYPAGTGQQFVVTNTNDSGPGSLRQAIEEANADTGLGVDHITFAIPASTAPNLNVPVQGFGPSTQTWTINLASPLPVITHAVSIDGYTQGSVGVPFRYPSDLTSQDDVVSVDVSTTGGSYVLDIAPYTDNNGMARGGQTPLSIPYNATAAFVQSQLDVLVGTGNVTVTGQTQATGPGFYVLNFGGASTGLAINLQVKSTNLVPAGAGVTISVNSQGGEALLSPLLISSAPNTSAAIDGNNAQIRVIVNGAGIPAGPSDIGFDLNASNSILRGLAVTGFGIGVEVPNPTDVGDLIQGNAIGEYLAYPVDPTTGLPLAAPNTIELLGSGNTQQGVVLGSLNTTLGGTDPQDSNVIGGNGMQGVLIEPGASGNQVLGNQIGLIGPSSSGPYFLAGNGAEGILIESSGTAADPSSIVYASSNSIGGAVGDSGNLISDNHGAGIHIEGVGATRNLVEGNYIGAAPGGTYVFGDGQPGNSGDGVWIDDAPNNQIGGATTADGNVISSNQGNGIEITGADAPGNTVANNIIGLTAAGSAALGNEQAGVADTAPGTTIGPGNVISANLIGVSISGSVVAATHVTVFGNLIGTDSTGEIGLGNANEGVLIDGSSGDTVGGTTAAARNVISGNLLGIKINGSASSGNLVEGNFIGVDATGTVDRGNASEGVLIEGASGNILGGSTAAALNVISANLYGIQIDGSTATGNVVEGNNIGTDVSGTLPLGNEIDGIIFSTTASNNTVGGAGVGQGNIIAFNAATGVLVQSGTGNSILTNSIYSNGRLGIVLNGTANNAQTAPSLTGAAGGGTEGNIEGTLTSVPGKTFVIQFFSSVVADPSGFGQGQTYIGETTVMTDPTTGIASINFNLSGSLAVGAYVTALATNESTGDSSAFSNAIKAQSVSVAFSMASYTVNSTAGTATITVVRSGNLDVAVSVNYATSNGTAKANQDYTPVAGTLVFPPNAVDESFTVPILDNQAPSASPLSVSLTLSQPLGGATLGSISVATLFITNQSTSTSKTFIVVNTNDSGAGSLRQAIIDANADGTAGVDKIIFAIPASTAANLNVPVAGFDPSTQTWTIDLLSPLPPIARSVSIDGYTQASVPVPYRYPSDSTTSDLLVALNGIPSGGTFTLTVSAPGSLPSGTTVAVPFDATAAQIQAALETIVGSTNGTSNAVVTGGPVNIAGVSVTFSGPYTGQAVTLTAQSSLTGGINPSVTVYTITAGGFPIGAPSLISSAPNSVGALAGNNAQVRVIIDGTSVATGASDIGFVINASDSILRGLAVTGFGIGVEIPDPADDGDLIQGDSIGEYLAYPVDPSTGIALPSPNTVELLGDGNSQQGILLRSLNTTVGGTDPQDSNVIGGNGMQGILIEPGASGNQVLGNQIGLIGPGSSGPYFLAGNGAKGS